MKKLLLASCCLLGLAFNAPSSAHHITDPATVFYGVFAWDPGTLNPRFLEYGNADYEVVDMASFGYTAYGQTVPGATNNIDIANYKNQKCAEMNGGEALVWSSFDGWNMIATVTPDSIVNYARLNSVNCRKIQIAPGRTLLYSDGYYNTGGQTLPSGGQVSDPTYFYNSGIYKTFCEANTPIPSGTAEIYYSMCYGIDPTSGNQCETPTGSVFAVDFASENHPDTICVDGCGAARTTPSIRLKTGASWNVFYSASGDACVGGETGIDGSNVTITDPEPVCNTHRGIEYCIDLANNRILKDGSVAWDFNNGDYYDGVCAISSSATFVCDGDATLPGTDNSDPYVDIAVDTDDDPQPEIVFIPDTSSGIARISPGTAVDTTGDGSPDSVAVDSNGDGVTDALRADANNDSIPDIDDPSTPNIDESAPPGDTSTTPGGNTGGGGNTDDNSTDECIDNLNTPWNECDTDGDGEGGEDGSCTDDPNTPWNDCSIGVDLDGCDSQPEVTGDPLQAAAIYLAWQDACSAYVPPEQLNNGSSLENSRPEDDGSFLSDSVDLPTALDQDGFISSGTSYPPIEFTVMDKTHQIDLHELEGILGIAGNLLVIMSLLWAGRLLTQG